MEQYRWGLARVDVAWMDEAGGMWYGLVLGDLRTRSATCFLWCRLDLQVRVSKCSAAVTASSASNDILKRSQASRAFMCSSFHAHNGPHIQANPPRALSHRICLSLISHNAPVSTAYSTLSGTIASKTPTMASPLLALPGELRNRIYHHAVVQHGIDVTTTGFEEPALLLTCKTVSNGSKAP